MRRGPFTIFALGCICLLAMQISGLHLHANLHGEALEVHGSHVHQTDPDEHDHTADVDVSLLELSVGRLNFIGLLPNYVLAMLAVSWTLLTLWLPPVAALPIRRRSRWRPPLRAPPIFA